ncbi:HAD domain-containing protein [Cupriavidus sp. AcVe19-6a]|uniref:HAD domain-containing protein n=1 Tax=Cupriavidus sp. AcVe19-6a TaxID=2821358 RepID=UPI001AE68BD1|nr:HAD domain-containing protein [Cupriavidus sp. AcVe19-6a]MBP0638012.1 hypothetical protein [Cupriavidus sp. AcVe19-6a]
MSNSATLYLGFEGVLHPNLVSFYGQRLPRLRAAGHALFENNSILKSVMDAHPDTSIVLHNWWVPLVGYRAAIEMLPASVRPKIIGATWRSIKGPRSRLRMARTRRAWLEEDLWRRCPDHPVLLDCDFGQAVAALADCSCIVDELHGLAAVGASDRLARLLKVSVAEGEVLAIASAS